MADVDLSSVINMIMENPELIEKIKGLAQSGERVNTAEEKRDIDAPPSVRSAERTEQTATKHVSLRRSELIRALSPYISGERQKAIETFMTIADILDMMRTK